MPPFLAAQRRAKGCGFDSLASPPQSCHLQTRCLPLHAKGRRRRLSAAGLECLYAAVLARWAELLLAALLWRAAAARQHTPLAPVAGMATQTALAPRAAACRRRLCTLCSSARRRDGQTQLCLPRVPFRVPFHARASPSLSFPEVPPLAAPSRPPRPCVARARRGNHDEPNDSNAAASAAGRHDNGATCSTPCGSRGRRRNPPVRRCARRLRARGASRRVASPCRAGMRAARARVGRHATRNAACVVSGTTAARVRLAATRLRLPRRTLTRRRAQRTAASMHLGAVRLRRHGDDCSRRRQPGRRRQGLAPEARHELQQRDQGMVNDVHRCAASAVRSAAARRPPSVRPAHSSRRLGWRVQVAHP